MNKHKQFLVIILLLAAAMQVRADEPNTQQAQIYRAAQADMVDQLLDDAQQCGVLEEPVHIKPVGTTERLLRVVGGALLLNYLALKGYVADTWQYLFASSAKGEHELQA